MIMGATTFKFHIKRDVLFAEIAYPVYCAIVAVLILSTSSCCTTSDSVSTRGGVVELPGKEPVRRFLVIGFGIVSVKPSDEETSVMVLDQTALGMYAGNLPAYKVGIGYHQSTITVVPEGLKADDVRIEVVRKPFKGIEINTWSAVLKNDDDGSLMDKKDKEGK